MEVFVDRLDLPVQEQRRNAQQQPEHGGPAERDRDVHDRRTAHRLDDEEAEDAVDDVERASEFIEPRAVVDEAVEERGLEHELGEEKGRQADEGAPDHPADSLVVAWREQVPPADQDGDRGDC